MFEAVEINQRFKNQLKAKVVEEFEKSGKPRWNLVGSLSEPSPRLGLVGSLSEPSPRLGLVGSLSEPSPRLAWWPVMAPLLILIGVVGWSLWNNRAGSVTLPLMQSEAVSLESQLKGDDVILAAIEFREL